MSLRTRQRGVFTIFYEIDERRRMLTPMRNGNEGKYRGGEWKTHYHKMKGRYRRAEGKARVTTACPKGGSIGTSQHRSS